MSLPLDLLGKAIVALVASAGVAIPVSHALKSTSVERVKLESEDDLKKSCLIVLQGEERGDSDNKDKKLIVCQRDKNPWTTEFFFYDSSKDFSTSELKIVNHIEIDSGSTEAVLVFEGNAETSQKETIENLPPRTWTSLRGINLKEKTTVDMKGKKMQFEDNGQVTHCDLKEFSQ
ncbi:hypothetical protein WEN_02420 [Mycoplasma wenyonii str. Massachusetts]|uniref:Uncharacterized protein n=1 Tax=Mycoplasma wenyonii (strain Massachusetts) TaxID=1197325 RepID=I6YBC0_MYCWM|nr:hypothetical protein [Mycoplasma wenyonii]AFN65271.1 hypothetical protein WEN_02420 [Mycoplasma wenyonii str. Massachusetts]